MKIKTKAVDKTIPYRKPPKPHRIPLICEVCGVSSHYVKDKCWLCNTPFNIGDKDEN